MCRPRRLLHGSHPPLPHPRKPWRPLQPSPPAAACRSCPHPPPISDHTARVSFQAPALGPRGALPAPALFIPTPLTACTRCLSGSLVFGSIPPPHTHPTWPLECELHRVHRSQELGWSLEGHIPSSQNTVYFKEQIMAECSFTIASLI